MYLACQSFNAFAELPRCFGQSGVLLDEFHQLFRMLFSHGQTLIVCHGQILPVPGIGLGVYLVPVRNP
jgi:hypothetical protein